MRIFFEKFAKKFRFAKFLNFLILFFIFSFLTLLYFLAFSRVGVFCEKTRMRRGSAAPTLALRGRGARFARADDLS